MGEESAGTGLTAEEAAYYRAVEDHFARLRGTPFLFSPKDFSLLRGWWAEGVPLAAVLAGIGEVFERRSEAEGDPVSSLSYCRHAVARHSKRLTPVGAAVEAPGVDVASLLSGLVEQLQEAAGRWRDETTVSTEIGRMADAVASLAADSDPSALDEALARVELGVVGSLAEALPEAQRKIVDRAVSDAVAGSQLNDEVRRRTERAVRLRAVREVLGLPRLALHSDGA